MVMLKEDFLGSKNFTGKTRVQSRKIPGNAGTGPGKRSKMGKDSKRAEIV